MTRRTGRAFAAATGWSGCANFTVSLPFLYRNRVFQPLWLWNRPGTMPITARGDAPTDSTGTIWHFLAPFVTFCHLLTPVFGGRPAGGTRRSQECIRRPSRSSLRAPRANSQWSSYALHGSGQPLGRGTSGLCQRPVNDAHQGTGTRSREMMIKSKSKILVYSKNFDSDLFCLCCRWHTTPRTVQTLMKKGTSVQKKVEKSEFAGRAPSGTLKPETGDRRAALRLAAYGSGRAWSRGVRGWEIVMTC